MPPASTRMSGDEPDYAIKSVASLLRIEHRPSSWGGTCEPGIALRAQETFMERKNLSDDLAVQMRFLLKHTGLLSLFSRIGRACLTPFGKGASLIGIAGHPVARSLKKTSLPV